MEATPSASRPTFPDGYGLPETNEDLLTWEQVEPRLVEGRFWYDGAPTTRHTRDVEENHAVTLTLESGTDVVIVEGKSHATRADSAGLGVQLAETFGKYADAAYSPGADSWSGEDGGQRVITPARVLAWRDFP